MGNGKWEMGPPTYHYSNFYIRKLLSVFITKIFNILKCDFFFFSFLFFNQALIYFQIYFLKVTY